MDESEIPQVQKRSRIRHFFKFLSLLSVYLVEGSVDAAHEYMRIIAREKEIFIGIALSLIGLLNFNSGRYCDGNTADYLSCTRPATYYYFDALDIVLLTLGVFFITLWFIKRKD